MHMAQLMPLPLTVSCFSEIQIGFNFLVLAHPGSPGIRAVKRVCVCVCVCSVDKISNIDTTATQTRALTTTLATIHNNYSAAAAAACLIYP